MVCTKYWCLSLILFLLLVPTVSSTEVLNASATVSGLQAPSPPSAVELMLSATIPLIISASILLYSFKLFSELNSKAMLETIIVLIILITFLSAVIPLL